MAVSISSTHPLSSIDVSPFSPRPWLCKLLCPLQLAILGPSKWRASSSSSLLLIFFFPFSLSELPPFHLSMFSIYLWNQRCLCSKVARNGRAENRINIGTDERKAFVHLCMCACDWCPMSAERQEKMDVTGCSGNWNKLWVSAGFPFLSSSLSLSLSHMFSSPLKSISGDLSSPSRRGAGQDSSALIFLCNAAKILFVLQNPVTYSFIYRRLTVINFSANQICNSKGNYQHRLPTFIFIHWNYFNAARINSVNNLE